jgi:hypothetical protein
MKFIQSFVENGQVAQTLKWDTYAPIIAISYASFFFFKKGNWGKKKA